MKVSLIQGFFLRCVCAALVTIAMGAKGLSQIPDSTFFKDDFDRDSLGSSWIEDGSWSIINGSAYNFTGGPGGTLKTDVGYSRASYIIETAALGFNENYFRYFRITFGQADISNDQLYELSYTAWLGGRLTLSRSENNVFYPRVLDEIAVFPELSPSQWYKFKIAKYESGLIQVFMDKGSGYGTVPLLEAIDSTYASLGHFGWQIDTDAFPEDFYVDWINASKPGTEKPAIREKPAEDSLITQITALSGAPYKTAKLYPGVNQFIDRDYTVTSIPGYLNGASFIQSANADKFNTADTFLTFFLKSAAIIYIGYDPRSEATPGWLSEWTKSGDSIKISDEKAGYLNVYGKLTEGFGNIYPFPTILGGNLASPALNANINYLVAAIKLPAAIKLQAEDAMLYGSVVANNHPGYNGTGFVDFKNPESDYIEWTVPISVPGAYDVGFKYANGGPTPRSLQITVNGTITDTLKFVPGFLLSWASWSSTVSSKKVFLSNGTNKIRIIAIGTSGPNVDELNINFSSLSVKSPSTIAKRQVAESSILSNPVTIKLAGKSTKVYPNPFSQSTVIYYRLNVKAYVELSVFNLHGQQIQSLESGMHNPGNYQTTFNGAKAVNGMYFYRLQIGDEVTVGKLVKR